MQDEAVTPQDIAWLGIAAATIGCLVGGMLFGLGLAMVVNRVFAGLVLIVPAAPVAGGIGWLLSRRLARQLGGHR